MTAAGPYYSGQPGLRHAVYESTYYFSYADMPSQTLRSETLLTAVETRESYDDFYGQTISGYFVAPDTADYKFYLACDRTCQLNLSPDSLNPDSKVNQIEMGWQTY